MSRRLKETISIIILCMIFVVLQITTIRLSIMQMSMYNGVIMALQYIVCILLIRFGKNRGIYAGIILLSLSILLMVKEALSGPQSNVYSGIVNGSIYLVSLFIISRYFSKREKESLTDSLTGEMNLLGVKNYIGEKIDKEDRFSIIYLYLDNYKAINDTYGHSYGEELVRKIALKMNVKLGKDGVIARLGNSEFVVVVNDNRYAEAIANMLIDNIQEKITVFVENESIDCYLQCYGGMASYPNDARDAESLIKYADMAMLKAMSENAKSTYIFDYSMLEAMNRMIEVEKFIKEGLKKDYFYLVYQPQYSLGDKKLRGFETLLRMKNPAGVEIGPAEFIPVAEKGDLIYQIDDYVLNRAMVEFKDIVLNNKELTVSVNVSANNIADENFPEKIKKIIADTQFPPQNLEIEITEYCMVNSMDITINNIRALREMGIQIALDDFGTGYTSLNYVAKLPINLLKIDKSLVDDIENSDRSREFVRTVISLGHLMGCEVISEGVEDEKQLKCLQQDRCDFVQGYIWGKPLDYEVAKGLCG